MIWAVAQLKTETTKICKKSSKSCSEHDSTLRKIFFRFGRRRIRESARTSLFKNVEPKKYHNTWRSQWICIFYYHTFVWRWRTAGRQRPAGLAGWLSRFRLFLAFEVSFVRSFQVTLTNSSSRPICCHFFGAKIGAILVNDTTWAETRHCDSISIVYTAISMRRSSVGECMDAVISQFSSKADDEFVSVNSQKVFLCSDNKWYMFWWNALDV